MKHKIEFDPESMNEIVLALCNHKRRRHGVDPIEWEKLPLRDRDDLTKEALAVLDAAQVFAENAQTPVTTELKSALTAQQYRQFANELERIEQESFGSNSVRSLMIRDLRRIAKRIAEEKENET